jgi:restriction system protein
LGNAEEPSYAYPELERTITLPEKTIWGVHMALEHGVRAKEVGFVAVGWSDVGDLSRLKPNREDFKAAYRSVYPDSKPGNIAVSAGVLYRFSVEMQPGDVVVYPCKADRTINIGLIDGPYRFDASAAEDCPNIRPVRWLKSLPREEFSQTALYEMGSFLTLFEIKNNADEVFAAMRGESYEHVDLDAVSASELGKQSEESTEDFIIKRLKMAQTHYQFEHFVAHLLTCMGYHARVTKSSGDGGIDIIAHRDELGFEPPIIKVQCKQIISTIGRPDVQQLHGAIEPGEHGLFVTLGGFSNDARTYERTKPNLRLIDGSALIDLIYAHYHAFEPRYQMLLPLKRSYIPGPIVDGD